MAKNTLLLYVRMLLMMFIGLFTSRIVLRCLGIEDVGVFNAVAGVVTMFTLFSNSIAQAISSFMTYSLGQGDSARLSKV
ncbi:MAG: lipopolysaccharide biosynthesis protein, partial [Bacteroidales bacterium]|nr:lipopolysaccharide biosynthesis protein [Bacteroidales bacterium]